MKKIVAYLLFGLTIGAASSCEEIPPAIDFTPINTALLDSTALLSTPPMATHKVVLIEEFTGMKCVNCPNGHLVTKALHELHDDSVIVMAIHSYPIAPPASWNNLQINEGVALDNYLGPAPAWPAASVDRVAVSGTIINNAASWGSTVISQLSQSPDVLITIKNNYDATPIVTDSGTVTKLKTKITVVLLSSYTSTLKLSVMLQEDHIIAPQETSAGINNEYDHEFVLRDMFTSYNGTALSAQNTLGRLYLKEFELYIPTGWNMNNSNVVAFVHEEGAIKKVLQAAIAPVN